MLRDNLQDIPALAVLLMVAGFLTLYVWAGLVAVRTLWRRRRR